MDWNNRMKKIRMMEPNWICPKCGAKITTAMPQLMAKCPVCDYKTKIGILKQGG